MFRDKQRPMPSFQSRLHLLWLVLQREEKNTFIVKKKMPAYCCRFKENLNQVVVFL